MSRKFIIAGGGTGGHIFPAVSIASEIKRREPDAEILFVGAKGGMEMSVVPKYGFPIEAVWISGIQRQLSLRNILRNMTFPVKLFVSMMQANRIVNRFRPQVVVGVGGYASGPMGRMAASKGIPLVICEQNAFPGLVNRWLSKKADKILLGNEAAKKYFPSSKVSVTGNPIRSFESISREEAAKSLGLDPNKPTLLSVGGSLGALTINQALKETATTALNDGVQLIWQSGKRYYETLKTEVSEHENLRLMPFIDNMAAAYAAADLVISRAGGSTISEMIALSKPSILVPSPNVSEDHQTKNALSLSEKGAAVLIRNSDAKEKLISEALNILRDDERLSTLAKNISAIEKHDAAKEIVDQIFELI